MQKVRLVGADGEMIGVVSIDEALAIADEEGLDLVEISPQSDPPVCKVLNYGKHRYEEKKRKQEVKKKQKTIEVKEVKFRPGIDTNDYNVKMRNIHKFIGEGNKVKVTLRFKGREIAHQDIGMKLFERIIADVDEIAKVEFMPKLEGKQAVMVLAPR